MRGYFPLSNRATVPMPSWLEMALRYRGGERKLVESLLAHVVELASQRGLHIPSNVHQPQQEREQGEEENEQTSIGDERTAKRSTAKSEQKAKAKSKRAAGPPAAANEGMDERRRDDL